MAMRATGRLPVFATIPRYALVYGHAHSYVRVRMLLHIDARLHAKHYACTPPVAWRCTARAASRALSRSLVHARTHIRTHMGALGRRDAANAFAERARLHWRHSQPIGLSSDEFTPPERRAELLRGGQFALRITALAFFSIFLFPLLLFFFFLSSFGFPSCSSVSPFVLASSPSPPFPATRKRLALWRRSCSRGRRSNGSKDSEGNINSSKGAKKYYGDLSENFLILYDKSNYFRNVNFIHTRSYGMKRADASPHRIFFLTYRNFLNSKL